MYSEEAQAAELIESLLVLDYPADKRQIVIVSNGSTDGIDDIVRIFSDRRVELLRLERSGKTACENAAAHLRGEIIVNTDASIRIRPDAVKRLIAAFQDAEVGLPSGRDMSGSGDDASANLSRDFAAAFNCQEHGYRAVSGPEAVCLVPRTTSLRREYGR